MTAQLIDGKAIASRIRQELADNIRERQQQGLRPPGLAVILVGNNPASAIYVKNKREACVAVGIQSNYYPLAANTSQETLSNLIIDLNHDPNIDGILLQLPLPNSLDSESILELINPNKDVDGFHPFNLGRLAQRRPLLRPCTPLGVIKILQHINQPFKGKHAVIIGASNIVGRPMSLELLLAGCTVTVCHRFTQDLISYVKQADILISAVGKPNLIKGEWIKPDSTVIDVGITRLADGTLAGDVEFAAACQHAAWITPVPGGVGPMTVAMLLQNTFTAAYHRQI